MSVHRCNDRLVDRKVLRNSAQPRNELRAPQTVRRCQVSIEVADASKVRARTECALSGTREDCDPQIVLITKARPLLDQSIRRIKVDGVMDLGAIDRQNRDWTLRLKLKCHPWPS